jgi:hypothetical protein
VTQVTTGKAAPDETIPVALQNVRLDVEKQLVVAQGLGIDGGLRMITHNFCDACTWWHESTEHTGQASTSGDQLTYDLTGHTNLIDMRHGRVTYEDDITDATVSPGGGGTMSNIVPTVYLDGAAIDQAAAEDDDAHADRYTIDYENGTVTFDVARGGGVVVTADFRKAASSKFTIKPGTSKKIVLQDAEVDCSEDIDMTAPFWVDTWGSHTTITGGSVVSLSKRVYKKMHDFQAAARRFWGPIPSGFGGTAGVASPKWTFEWQYSRSDELWDTANYRDVNLDVNLVTLNRVEISLVGDVPYGGHFLTVTMYGYELAEGA